MREKKNCGHIHHHKFAFPQILNNISASQTYLATSVADTTQPEIRVPTEQREAAVAR